MQLIWRTKQIENIVVVGDVAVLKQIYRYVQMHADNRATVRYARRPCCFLGGDEVI